ANTSVAALTRPFGFSWGVIWMYIGIFRCLAARFSHTPHESPSGVFQLIAAPDRSIAARGCGSRSAADASTVRAPPHEGPSTDSRIWSMRGFDPSRDFIAASVAIAAWMSFISLLAI